MDDLNRPLSELELQWGSINDNSTFIKSNKTNIDSNADFESFLKTKPQTIGLEKSIESEKKNVSFQITPVSLLDKSNSKEKKPVPSINLEKIEEKASGLIENANILTPKKPKWFSGRKENHRLMNNNGLISIIIPYNADEKKYIASNVEDLSSFKNKEYITDKLDEFNKSTAINQEDFQLYTYQRLLFLLLSLILTSFLIYVFLIIVVLTLFNFMICFIFLVLIYKFIMRLIIIYSNIEAAVKSGIVKQMIEKENLHSIPTHQLTWIYGRDGLYLEINFHKSIVAK